MTLSRIGLQVGSWTQSGYKGNEKFLLSDDDRGILVIQFQFYDLRAGIGTESDELSFDLQESKEPLESHTQEGNLCHREHACYIIRGEAVSLHPDSGRREGSSPILFYVASSSGVIRGLAIEFNRPF